MKRLTLLGLSLIFMLSIGACDKKGAAPDEGAAKTEKVDKSAKKDEAKKDEAKKDEAKKDEAKKDEAKKDAPGATADEMKGWSDTCKKVAACEAAWAKEGPEGFHKDQVVEGWGEMKADISKNLERWNDLGCKTALKSWSEIEGAPAACK